MPHTNNGNCEKCDQIFDKYAGFNIELRKWFKEFQKEHPEAHISCAGRGEKDQNDLFIAGRTRAKFGQSAHNYGAAIDVFCVMEHSDSIYDLHWFKTVLSPEIPEWLNWYGRPHAPFPELPHIEIANWKDLAKQHILEKIEAK